MGPAPMANAMKQMDKAAACSVDDFEDCNGKLCESLVETESFPTEVWKKTEPEGDCDCQMGKAKERLGKYMGCIDKNKDTQGGKLWKSGAKKICSCGGKPDGAFSTEGLECLPAPMAN